MTADTFNCLLPPRIERVQLNISEGFKEEAAGKQYMTFFWGTGHFFLIHDTHGRTDIWEKINSIDVLGIKQRNLVLRKIAIECYF